jgi:valyl-tRNA synthetase
MKPLPQNYDHRLTEKKWQEYWETNQVYSWKDDQPRDKTYVIDTPPPTVSGVLHMGHIFSYTQADFVARYQRMRGMDVFYPMGFDDNGLPTERLVEKVKKVRPADLGREEFIKVCEEVSLEARKEFRRLFESVALSVDWKQEYHTISAESRKISQLSFLDLFNKGRAYRKLQPMLWDPADQTAIAQAEVEDKEVASCENYIPFAIVDADATANPATLVWEKLEKVNIMTTRPELLGACVALMCHPDDAAKYKGKKAVTPLFNVVVPIVADEKVNKEKGTGLVMCCTFGDETDIAWWEAHQLEIRIILNKFGKIAVWLPSDEHSSKEVRFSGLNKFLDDYNTINIDKTIEVFQALQDKKVSNTDPKNPGAREITIKLLQEHGLLIEQKPLTHAVKCAERSGAPLEFLPTHQWFIKILDQKEQLKEKAAMCNWHPEYMRIRINQWIDGLSWDWCISRQRYFGVPFPVWYITEINLGNSYSTSGIGGRTVIAKPEHLPVNPIVTFPDWEFSEVGIVGEPAAGRNPGEWIVKTKDGRMYQVCAELDVMDTWATSSISPQLSSKGINSLTLGEENPFVLDASRHSNLFPADLRPQAHEIIRTWAFYTIVKAHLHEDKIPWKNLMISGWCLASDKSKMSKSKGNVITPVDLIEEKGADVVRFWASTSRLGADTAFSEDVLKIGKKLVTKLWNATKFAAIHLDKLQEKPGTALQDAERKIITEPLDLWILTRLNRAITIATQAFDKYEYCDARIATEDFFWNDFCDNYLELVKGRVYGQNIPLNLGDGVGDGSNKSETALNPPPSQRENGQKSAVYTIYHCLDGILRLFAPIVPHVTDELYTHIFDDNFDDKVNSERSIHSRGNWPNAANYPVNKEFEIAGIATVGVLNAVRKLKAERGVSIKWPLNFICISGDGAQAQFSDFAEDLKNVTGATQIIFTANKSNDGQILTTKTDDGKFQVSAQFAQSASNSDAA